MLYYIFRVQANEGPDCYIINNKYVGYLGVLLNFSDSHDSPTNRCLKKKYQVFASGELSGNEHKDMRELMCAHDATGRHTLEEARNIAKQFKLKLSSDDTWYEVYYPNKNSTESYLREISDTQQTVRKTIQ